MRRPIAVAVGTLLASAQSTPLARAEDSPKVVQWDISKRDEIGATGRRLALAGRSTSTVQETITNQQLRGGYFASCSIGTPAQNLTLQLDTGSSDIWVPASTASVCTSTSSSSDGCSLGSFTSSSSSTFDDFDAGGFSIQYVDGSSSKGDYFRDVFQIGGAKLTNMTMGLGLTTDIAYGLVGVGYALDEASVTSVSSGTYNNLPLQMVNEGMIVTPAYSLWLNDLDASSGSILFGGIDTDKYKGDLMRIKVYPTNGYYASFLVALTSMSAHSSSGSDTLTSSSFPIYAVLDSGTTLSYVPTDLAEQIWNEVGAVYSASEGIALIPCSRQNSDGYFSFGFAGTGGPVINITMDELVLDLSSGAAPTFASGVYKGQEACEFGIQNFSSSSTYLLGDTFLRSAYVVYDLANNEIGIAPTDFNATNTNIVAFASKSATIPSSTEAPSQSEIASSGSAATPSYAAGSGFSSGISNAALGSPEPLSFAQLGVMGITLAFTMLGSGFFLLL